jgi:integrase/recombinase XerD
MDMNTALQPYEGTFVEEMSQADSDSTLIDAWLHGTPETTQRAYRREIRTLLGYTGKSLQDITIFDLQAYERDELMSKADTSRKRAISAIRSLYAWLLRAGLIQVNPSALIRLPKINETIADRYLTPDEVYAVIGQAKTPRDKAMMELMYYGGLRVSEIVALTWNDIRTQEDGNAVLSVIGKGGKLRRVSIDAEMLQVLQAQRVDGRDSVFASRKHGEMSTTQAQRIVVDAGLAVGIDCSPHFFRHAHASEALEQGVNIANVRDELGHASIATTNKYVHATGSTPIGSVLRRK